VRAQNLQQGADVVADRGLGELQLLAYLPDRLAFGQQFENL
jgi:hypothetical protein